MEARHSVTLRAIARLRTSVAMDGLQPDVAAPAQALASTPPLAFLTKLIGPEATAQEGWAVLAGAAGLTVLAAAAGATRASGWSILQWVLALGLAFDIGGGVVGSWTRSAARWSHRSGQGRARTLFYAGHLHPLALALLFATPWAQAVGLYVGMLLAAAIVEVAPRAVARAVAVGVVALLLGVAGGFGWPAGLEWFVPAYLLKLVGHAVPPEA